jgi:hypothetical protein
MLLEPPAWHADAACCATPHVNFFPNAARTRCQRIDRPTGTAFFSAGEVVKCMDHQTKARGFKPICSTSSEGKEVTTPGLAFGG